MITYIKTKTAKAAATKTCSTCPNFDNFHESNGRGWCEQFNHFVRGSHEETQTCSNSLKESPKENLMREQAFPSEVLELDREGYPMGKETVENGYFDQNFVTYPNEPF